MREAASRKYAADSGRCTAAPREHVAQAGVGADGGDVVVEAAHRRVVDLRHVEERLRARDVLRLGKLDPEPRHPLRRLAQRVEQVGAHGAGEDVRILRRRRAAVQQLQLPEERRLAAVARAEEQHARLAALARRQVVERRQPVELQLDARWDAGGARVVARRERLDGVGRLNLNRFGGAAAHGGWVGNGGVAAASEASVSLDSKMSI